jgi:hypothetical protein
MPQIALEWQRLRRAIDYGDEFTSRHHYFNRLSAAMRIAGIASGDQRTKRRHDVGIPPPYSLLAQGQFCALRSRDLSLSML